MLGFAFASNYKLTLYLLVASLLFVVPMYLSSYAEYRQAFVGVQYLGRVIRLAEATFCNIEILKTYQNEGYIVERFGKFHNYYLSHSRKWVIVASCCNGIVWTLFYLTVLGVIAIGRSISEFGKDFLCRTKDVSFQNWAKLDLTHGPLNEKGPQSFIIVRWLNFQLFFDLTFENVFFADTSVRLLCEQPRIGYGLCSKRRPRS